MDLRKTSALKLLQFYGKILSELQERKIIRSSNSPLGDYTEWLVTNKLKKLKLKLQKNSSAGYDAINLKGETYQIKGRRLTAKNQSTELGAIRDLNKKPFDFLIAVVYKENFTIDYAAKLSCEFVKNNSKYVERTNAWKFLMRREFLKKSGVENITKYLII